MSPPEDNVLFLFLLWNGSSFSDRGIFLPRGPFRFGQADLDWAGQLPWLPAGGPPCAKENSPGRSDGYSECRASNVDCGDIDTSCHVLLAIPWSGKRSDHLAVGSTGHVLAKENHLANEETRKKIKSETLVINRFVSERQRSFHFDGTSLVDARLLLLLLASTDWYSWAGSGFKATG